MNKEKVDGNSIILSNGITFAETSYTLSFHYSSCYPSVELGSLTTANLMEKVKGLQNLAYQLGLEECKYLNITHLKLKRFIYKCLVPFSLEYNLSEKYANVP